MNASVEQGRSHGNTNRIRGHSSAKSLSRIGDDAKSPEEENKQMLRGNRKTRDDPKFWVEYEKNFFPIF